MKKTPLLKSYSTATRMAAPALPLWLKRRARKGKEDPARLGERNGVAGLPRPDLKSGGKLIWLHAASVGESQMLMPVILRILAQFSEHNIVITTGTVTSAELLAETLPTRAVHQYAPADHPKAVANFLAHWQPDLAIFAESELWPNMIMQTKALKIPMALINARMSATSIERWDKRGKKSGQVLLGAFDLIMAADTTTAAGLTWLTGREVEAAGNLKDAAPALPVDKLALQKLKSAIGRRPVWCAASTHVGEEILVGSAALAVKAKKPKALLILAPRHPERAKEVKDILTKMGLSVLRRSSHRMPTDKTDVYLVDQIGKMGLVYRLAKTAFVGGSLLEGLSGHNPLEPARLDCAVITGPHIASFADTYMPMMAFDGVKRILSPDDLAPAVLKYLSDPKARKAKAKAALNFAESRDAVLDYVWQHLHPLLKKA
ncbi:MAG: 3-deoxy-D-manno-octulosonic acid transferase [Robiginitomaculum sp.]|nr:MAG: 3-deoxy-D-manno-octulosonic acid transferase [Robiginitomaculum sp.]